MASNRDSRLTTACDVEGMRAAMLKAAGDAASWIAPPMPGTLGGLRTWLRAVHDAYSEGKIEAEQLWEARKTASEVGKLHQAQAHVRTSEAAMVAAVAQERMANTLLAVEHGGQALVMYERLQDSLTGGRRRQLPGRVVGTIQPEAEQTA